MNRLTLNKVDKTTTKIERKAKRIARKMKLIAILVGCILALALVFWLFMGVSKWYDENKVIFQSPIIIKIQSPILIKPRVVKKAIVVPLKEAKKEVKPRTEFEIVVNTKYGDILWKIYQLETQRGLTDGCRLKGSGYGGFGVMNAGEVICYPTFEKAVERASFWLAKMKPEANLVSALCQWNTGTSGLVNCSYYQSFISL